MASDNIEKMKDAAQKLYDLRQLIEKKEEEKRVELEGLKMERDAIQAILLAEMKDNGLASLRIKSGDSFSRVTGKTLEVVSEPFALKWAVDHRAVTINKTLAKQILEQYKEVPDCFRIVPTEYISVRKAKEK